MFLAEFQEVPEGENTHLEEVISNIDRQRREGITSEISFHSQAALFYGCMKRWDECKLHAALVPDTASTDDRLNKIISLARMHIYYKEIDEAITYYHEGLSLDSKHEMILLEIGYCYYELKQYAQAEYYFRKSLEDTPDFGRVWECLGLSLSFQERYKEAIDCFKKALEFQPNDGRNYYYEYLIGVCYGHLKDFYRAMAHYTKSLDNKPLFAPSLTNIGTLYFEHESDIKTAISYLLRAQEIAEAEEDSQLVQLIYINLIRLYKMIAEYDLQEYYNHKLLQVLGFEMSDDNEDEHEEGNEEPED